jgi:glycosyltransferase involved in cell wall biosynthesis
VGTLCRLEPIKGISTLAEAAGRLLQKQGPLLFFLIIGDGPEKFRLEKVQGALPDRARLILAGHQARPFSLLAALDIYVQPSLNEGMGKTLIMAQAMGLPIVASRVCGIPNVVQDNETGILVPPGDSRALAEGIEKLSASPDLRDTMGKKGQSWVNLEIDGLPQFGVERMVALLEKTYDDVLANA